MWFVDSLARIPLQKLYLTLVATLGAGFLLLAFLLKLNPLLQPLTYLLVAFCIYAVHRKEISMLRGAIFSLSAFALSFSLLPAYLLLFSSTLSLVIGKLIYSTSLRFWKWMACSFLLYGGIHITSTWQQIAFLNGLIPFQLSPLLHAAIFSFFIACSLFPYYVVKDSVRGAYDSFRWIPRTEPARIALQAKDLYEGVKGELRRQNFDPRVLEELEEFSEKMIYLCHKLQEMNEAISTTDVATLEQDILNLQTKVDSTSDLTSKRNYEKALQNRQKQKEQFDSLEIQAERIRAQLLNYISALENVKFAYTHRHFNSAESGTEGIEFLLQMTKNQAENVYATSEAYQKLV